MRDVSLDDLAGCNNPDCRAGCGWYEYTSLQPGVSLAMTPCVVCGCRGSQHRENRRQAAPTVPTPAPFIPLATPELPSTSHSASTLPSSSFSSFGGPSFASTSSSGFNAPEPTPPPGFSAGRFGTHPEVVAGGSQPQTSFSATARSLFGSRPPALSGSQPQRGREPLRGSTAAPPGHVSSWKRVLKGGEYGMRRFCALVVNRVLDDLDAAHPDYRSVLGSVQGACLSVARKIRNYFKRGGATSAPEPKNTETGTEDGTAGPRTRSRSKRTTGNNDENSDSMTNTDSLESGWENDYSDGEPDVLVRRAQRHAQRQKPPPQPARPRPRPRPRPKLKTPPIEISSDSESSSSSDTEWQKTYTRWRKRNAAPSTSAAPPPAPAPAPSQSRAQPAWMDPTSLEADDVEDANGLPRRSTARYWQGVMREVVERFPHPEPTRRITMGMLLAPGMTRRRQYHMLCLAYHVDRNVGGGAHWLRIAAILSQILNDTRTYKLDDPRVV
ncbi:hypothetical protein C8R46DRAFT_1344622 [Mycena filopes]|nr:hypothetical protein C8R46DRAFT_1344622 [Mycena filopes]